MRSTGWKTGSIFAIALTSIATVCGGGYAATPEPLASAPLKPAAGNVRVDFTAPTHATSALSVGSAISTYAGSGSNLIKGPQRSLWRQYLQDLGPMVWRIPLYYHDGQVGSSAGGVHGGDEGAAYIAAIKSIKGTPMIAVGGSTNDNDIQAADAARLVHYFNDGAGQHGGPVDYYIVGNEPDNGFGLNNYLYGGNGSSGFHANVSAMRSATTRRLTIAGPSLVTWADYKFGDFRTFFANANADADIVDFHKYGDGQHLDNLNRTYEYSDAVNWLRTEIGNYFGSRSADIGIQLGEFNYNSSYSDWNDAFYTSRNLVHTASVVGHMLQQGGRAYQYSDNNGPLGLISDGTGNNGQPPGQFVRLPAYWGLSAWTGGAWMRRFGSTMVAASTSLPEVEVYATDHAKKIILINKSTSTDQTATVALVGKDSGTYSVWQYARGMDPGAFASGPQFQPPRRIATDRSFSAGQLQVAVPWMSVVVVTVD
ncbi:hypothetical protein [Paraherbaspirillum soli]|uniref:Alpha-L-arabinofuranosidase n=1 Tax=Paraherbaspirillum soli TaxID=631222 RepID=A0ABW0M3P6_9BURK